MDWVAALAMLALLGLFAAPVWGNSERRGQVAECLSNLKCLGNGLLSYAMEHGDLLPPNPDDGNTVVGHNWCPGQAGKGGSAEFVPEILADPTRSLLFGYLEGGVSVFRCPADTRVGRYQGSDPAKQGTFVPAARSVSMNHAVGTVCVSFPGGHAGSPYVRTHAPWLDNNHAHTRNGPYRTFGQLTDWVNPGPSMMWTIMEEDPDSLNDGGFAFGMAREEWIDWPGTLHDGAVTIAFGDGHVENHRWVDARTFVVNGNVSRRLVPGSEDYQWLRERTSAPK